MTGSFLVAAYRRPDFRVDVTLKSDRALAGEHFYDGFITSFRKGEAKAIIAVTVAQLNEGKTVAPHALAEALAPYTP